MKIAITFIILLISLTSCAQDKKCSQFKTGEFRYANENLKFEIIRNDTLQIERNLETGVEIHTKVDWKSDCKYILTYEKILNTVQDVSSVIGKKIFVEILKTDGNEITVHAKSDAMDDQLEFLKLE